VGVFYVDCEIRNSESRGKSVLVKRLSVDSGAEYTWVSESLLAKAAIRVRKKDISFLMANGQTITRDVGYAIIRAQGFETVDEVVFARPGDLQLLGSRTLEGFAAVVDSRRKKLVAAGPIPAAKAIREHS
jgi:predicted aspartyl protease